MTPTFRRPLLSAVVFVVLVLALVLAGGSLAGNSSQRSAPNPASRPGEPPPSDRSSADSGVTSAVGGASVSEPSRSELEAINAAKAAGESAPNDDDGARNSQVVDASVGPDGVAQASSLAMDPLSSPYSVPPSPGAPYVDSVASIESCLPFEEAFLRVASRLNPGTSAEVVAASAVDVERMLNTPGLAVPAAVATMLQFVTNAANDPSQRAAFGEATFQSAVGTVRGFISNVCGG